MIGLLEALSFLVLIEEAIVVALLYRLDSVEEIPKKQLQKLLDECIN